MRPFSKYVNVVLCASAHKIVFVTQFYPSLAGGYFSQTVFVLMNNVSLRGDRLSISIYSLFNRHMKGL